MNGRKWIMFERAPIDSLLKIMKIIVILDK